MGTATLLTLLLPYLPNLLDFLSEQLGRALLRQQPNAPTKTNEERILETVKDIVNAVDAAHASWSDEDKHRAAVGGIREHLSTVHGITLSDSEINLLIELYIACGRNRGGV